MEIRIDFLKNKSTNNFKRFKNSSKLYLKNKTIIDDYINQRLVSQNVCKVEIIEIFTLLPERDLIPSLKFNIEKIENGICYLSLL
jgi:hypothetical protein